jgi:hypothetical protein
MFIIVLRTVQRLYPSPEEKGVYRTLMFIVAIRTGLGMETQKPQTHTLNSGFY